MNFSVLKSASYILAHTPEMVNEGGTTQQVERITAPDSEYLKVLDKHLRSFEDAVNYAPNQVYIGGMTYKELADVEAPWHENLLSGQDRYSSRGEIMPEDEFVGLLAIVDVFDLVHLEKGFIAEIKEKLSNHELLSGHVDQIKDHDRDAEWLQNQVDTKGATPLYINQKLVGVVERAHDVDVNLTSHIMFENLVAKASGVLAVLNLLKQKDIDPNEVDYVLECSEEAIGDMNQRGGGNLAKAIAEVCHLQNATGSDMRGFCAAPTHTLIAAASMVQAGTHKNVLVVSGGSTAKLGMNGKSHVAKDMPILEDCVAGAAFLISANDGKSPVIRTDLIGKHTVNSGSSPQAVTTALVADALDKDGLTVNDIDVYASELQNPNITEPAGAGNVPLANLKIIGAVGVLRKEVERAALQDFIDAKYVPGWAPTQGHIPSGIPYLGFAIDDLTEGDFNRAMIIGKGSLFLGRMTNLFDGISVILQRNSGEVAQESDSDLKEVVKAEVANALRQFASNLTVEE